MAELRSSQIRAIIEAALRLSPAEREAYLAKISLTDRALRDEVVQRLNDHADSVTKSIPVYGRHVFSKNQVVVGRFRIVRFLGQGGMGEVYEAEDQELGTVVALKTIRPEMAEDRHALNRLRQETQLSRKITHPNVCRIFDFSRDGRVALITMELLSGETLADRLRHSRTVPLGEATVWVLQMIDGLAAAHRASVIHRDFKPGNVFLVPEKDYGMRVVITDFGLARAVDSNQTVTERGKVYGTLAYLSPEQLRGEIATAASDIYALGIVMFEMVTGHRPFEGADISSIMKRLNEPPPSPKLWVENIDPRWEAMILRCLQADPRMRFQSMQRVREWLAGSAASSDEQTSGAQIGDFLTTPGPALPSPTTQPTAARRARRRLLISSAVLLGLLIAAGIGLYLWSKKQNQPLTSGNNRGVVTQLTLDNGFNTNVTFSADGKLMAYSSDRSGEGHFDIWTEYQGGPPVRVTNGTKADQDFPALSPEGNSIAYRSEAEGSAIYINAALGGNERLLVKYGRNPRYSPDGKSITYWTGEWGHFVLPTGKIFVVPATGGEPRQLRPEFADARYPIWMDGRHIMFQGFLPGEGSPDERADWWVTDLDGTELVKTGAFDYLRQQDLRLYFSPPCLWKNAIIFSASKGNSTNLWRMPLSNRGYKAMGDPRPVTFGAALEAAPWMLPDGEVAFTSAIVSLNIWEIPLNPATGAAAGKPKQVTTMAALDTRPSLSADGKVMAFARRIGDLRNVWIRNLETGREANLTSSAEASPLINPDGQKVAYSVWEHNQNPIYIIGIDGGAPERVCEDCGNAVSWSPDGTKILYLAGHPTAIYALDVASGSKSPFLSKPGYQFDQAQISPDGRAVAFVVRISAGQSQIVLAPLRSGVAAQSNEWISAVVGTGWNDKPRWSADGRTIYFYSTRDGFPCIWRQRLKPGSLQPVDGPLGVLDLHDPEFSLSHISRGAFNFSVARNFMVLNIASSKANIWATSVPE
jgi:serine/threonine protein kinase